MSAIISSLLQSLPTEPVTLALDPPLTLLLGNSGGLLGIGVQGSIALSTGSPTVTLLLGQPGDAATVPGVQLALFSTGATPTFAPALNVHGLGVGFAGDGGSPLLNQSGCRIGDIDGFIAFTFDLVQGNLGGLGGGLSIGQLGLPLGLLDTVTGGNPVAASLLSSDGGSGGGDSSPVNPAVDVTVTYLGGNLAISFAGTSQPIVIPVHASFGPLYIDQIDLSLNGTNSVAIGIDGSLSINGLTVGVEELALLIPVASILQPGDWSVDLQGLAVGFDSGPVEISGGLRKNPGPPIEYDGMLSATIVDIGLTIVGAYSRPTDEQGAYTSLFLFAALMMPLGGPPFAFITGLGGGFGYNRELDVPDDLNQLDSFILVAAMDDDSLANDPLNALIQIGQQIPPRRGAFWIAAGVRLTTFALINSTVIVSIAIDRGLDIEILGVSRMALPTEDSALISIELALRARFNSSEQLLSVQAQLTDNSYLFSRDCQLTGGFALVIWYGQGQFVLTLGGYNPVFVKPPQFPDVPRRFQLEHRQCHRDQGRLLLRPDEFLRDGRRLPLRDRNHRPGVRLVRCLPGFPGCVGPVCLRIRYRCRDRRIRQYQDMLLWLRNDRRLDLGRRTTPDPGTAVPWHRLDRRLCNHHHHLVRRSAPVSAVHHRLERVRREIPDRRRPERQRRVRAGHWWPVAARSARGPAAAGDGGTALAGRSRIHPRDDNADAGLVLPTRLVWRPHSDSEQAEHPRPRGDGPARDHQHALGDAAAADRRKLAVPKNKPGPEPFHGHRRASFPRQPGIGPIRSTCPRRRGRSPPFPASPSTPISC